MEITFTEYVFLNITVLIASVVIYDYLLAHDFFNQKNLKLFLPVILTSLIGSFQLHLFWQFGDGIQYSLCSVLLTIAGLFMGWLPMILTIIILFVVRISMGGAGMWAGLLIIFFSGTFSVLWSMFRKNWREENTISGLLSLSIMESMISIFFILLLLQNHLSLNEFIEAVFPTLFLSIPSTIFIGLFLVKRLKSWTNKEMVKESEALYASLVDNIPASVFRKAPDGRFVFVNNQFCEFKGLESEEIIGKNSDELAEYENKKNNIEYNLKNPTDHHEWIMDNKKSIEVEVSYKGENKELKYFKVIKSPVFSSSGTLVGSQGLQFDITDQVNLESALKSSKIKAEESDRMKTAFIHNISHEIRTPMNSIIGFSDLLKEPNLTADDRTFYLDQVIGGAMRLLSIIDNMISVSTFESANEELDDSIFNLNKMCETVCNVFREAFPDTDLDFEFNASLPDSKAYIIGDEQKFVRIITNLLLNAFNFTKEGHIYFGYSCDYNVITFFIEDSGIGIPEEKKQNIFNIFSKIDYNRMNKGVGLGLAISRKYVELMGGKIWVESKLDEGSRFFFSIPYIPAPVE